MNDDEYGTLLLRPLLGEPAGPPRLDVAKAMRDGLRMRRRRWWAGGSTLIAAVTATLVTGGLLLSPAQDHKPKPPDIAPDGTIVGQVGSDAYLWPPDGTVRRLGRPPAPQPGPTDTMRPGELSRSSIDPIGFSFGWLYAEVSFPQLRNAELYRYDLGSGTWQRLGPAHGEAQLATAGSVSVWTQEEPRVWVGPRQLGLPQYLPSLRADLDVFLVKAVSDDVHVVAGTALSGPADLTLPYQPIIWRCR